MGRYNNDKSNYADIVITRGIFDLLAVKCPTIEVFRHDFCFAERVKIPVRHLTIDQLTELAGLLKENDDRYASVVVAYLNIRLRPTTIKVKNAKAAEPAIVGWLQDNMIRCWIFEKESKMPRLVTDVIYKEAARYDPAHVEIDTIYWEKNESKACVIKIYNGDCKGKDVNTILFDEGFVHETPELIAEFDALSEKYLEWRDQAGLQLVSQDSRLVNDMECVPKKKNVETRAINRLLEKPQDMEVSEDVEGVVNRDEFTRVPTRPWLWCFDLFRHKFGWHHCEDIRPYVYKPEVRKNLILSESHSDLIDALVNDLDLVTQDIVDGKGGGTTILCQGRPGTGKTLTAEVYAESVKRPLYRVHSGQLGTEPRGLEKVLTVALNRASRWNAILLIDEADVFLMQRTDDMTRNAVCGVFLRTLEYFKGLLFLTTNRIDSVDDAIVSRCIAVIRYENPELAERRTIWETQSKFNRMELDAALLDRLAAAWSCSGRDIKGLVRLTARYCRAHDRTPQFEDFQRMALFRGL